MSNSASDGQYRFLTNPYTSYLNGADTDCPRTRNYRYEFDSEMRTPSQLSYERMSVVLSLIVIYCRPESVKCSILLLVDVRRLVFRCWALFMLNSFKFHDHIVSFLETMYVNQYSWYSVFKPCCHPTYSFLQYMLSLVFVFFLLYVCNILCTNYFT